MNSYAMEMITKVYAEAFAGAASYAAGDRDKCRRSARAAVADYINIMKPYCTDFSRINPEDIYSGY